MITFGLLVELVAAALVVAGVVREAAGIPLLWLGIAVALGGLVVTLAGVRRARPPRRPRQRSDAESEPVASAP